MLQYYNKYYQLYGGKLVGVGVTSIVLTDPLPPVIPDYPEFVKKNNDSFLETKIECNFVAKCVTEITFDKEIELHNNLIKKIINFTDFIENFIFPVDTIKRHINFEVLNQNKEIYTEEWREKNNILRYSHVLIFPRGISKKEFILKNSIKPLIQFFNVVDKLKQNTMYLPDMKLDNIVLVDDKFKVIDFSLLEHYNNIIELYKNNIAVHAIYYLAYSVEYQLIIRFRMNNIKNRNDFERELNKEINDITRSYNLYTIATNDAEKQRIITHNSYVPFLTIINIFYNIFRNLLKKYKGNTRLKMCELVKLNGTTVKREIEIDINYTTPTEINKLLYYCLPLYTMIFNGYNESMMKKFHEIMMKFYIFCSSITPEQLQLYSYGIMILNFLYYKEKQKDKLEKQINNLDEELKIQTSQKLQEGLLRNKEILESSLKNINNFFETLNMKLLIDILLLCFIHFYNGNVILPQTELVREKINELLVSLV